MAKFHQWFFLVTLFCSTMKISPVVGATYPLDVLSMIDPVSALERIYKYLYYAPQLLGWKINGDPCGDNWLGISCDGTRVISITLNRLEIVGYLPPELYLLNLKQLDLSFNRIKGLIPYFLPPQATHVDLSSNRFSMQMPHSMMFMKELLYLNVSYNTLSGHLDMDFTGLKKLKQMDFSNNFFTGSLPRSFISLTCLTELYLQNNKFDGSIGILAKLRLTSLNIRDNNFTGAVPEEILSVKNLWIEGNGYLDFNELKFSGSDTKTTGRFNHAVSLAIVVSVVLVTFVAVLLRIYRNKNPRKYMAISLEAKVANKPDQNVGQSPSELVSGSLLSVCNRTTPDLTETRQKGLGSARSYTYEELRSATGNFDAHNLIGQSSVGRYFNAKFSGCHCQVLACGVPPKEEELFLDIVSRISKLKHPNIVQLLGYCIEHGQHLVYNYAGNLTLEHELCNNGVSLNWAVRIRIAVALAKALEYLHSRGLLLEIDCDLMAANVLLDKKFVPRFRDCGLAVLKPIIKTKKAKGYIDNEQQALNGLRNDVYSFGVLLLELLTGKKAFDSSRGLHEQRLVQWIYPLLSQENNLETIVDPALKSTKLLSSTLYEFANIASRCLEVNPGNRPLMKEVVKYLDVLEVTSRKHYCS